VRLENSFQVPATLDRVWEFMLDVPRVAPCMPGCELTEIVDDRTWKGKVNVKLGPVSLSYAGKAVMLERDDAAHRVVLKADGTETKGKGTASARVTSHMEDAGEGSTRVVIETDLTLSGAVAQFGRGMIGDVSQRLTDQFAETLKERMADPGEAGAAEPAGAAPVSGFRLGLWALFRAVGRFFARIGRALAAPFRRAE
jgi:carbon monoxide dehydrogenase subunit G